MDVMLIPIYIARQQKIERKGGLDFFQYNNLINEKKCFFVIFFENMFVNLNYNNFYNFNKRSIFYDKLNFKIYD